MPIEDEELISEILSGSPAAMEVLVKRHYPAVFSFVYRRVGNYHTAYDLTQEIFIKMIRSLTAYRQRGKFSHWLLTIAVHHCCDYHRGDHPPLAGLATAAVEEIPDLGANVWEVFSKQRQREAVRQAILSLPEYQRDAVILRFYHGLKIREIARIMQVSESTAKSRLYQGLGKLKRLLAGGDQHAEETGSHCS